MKISVLTALAVASLIQISTAQRAGRPSFEEMEKKSLAEGFKGVTTDGKVEKGLFEIKSTGVSTVDVKTAADVFLKALTEEQRTKTMFPVGDEEWRRWANQHSLKRQGVSFNEMNVVQRELAFKVIGAGLSAKGLKTTQDIMKLNQTIAELSNREGEYGFGRWAYYMTIMGELSETEPWGFQFDGHHCVINYFILKDQVVMTPLFLGSEPVKAESGEYKGTVILQEEQDKALAFAKTLTDRQRAKAVIDDEKAGTNSNAEAFKDNAVVPYKGLLVSELDPAQKIAFLELTGLWIHHLKEGHAKVKMEEIIKHLDKTRFAWIGEMKEDSVFYYRIHSPVVLIEFDHQRPIALGRSRTATRQHIHATVRTPNGNDYGKDLLKQHLHDHDHGK